MPFHQGIVADLILPVTLPGILAHKGSVYELRISVQAVLLLAGGRAKILEGEISDPVPLELALVESGCVVVAVIKGGLLKYNR